LNRLLFIICLLFFLRDAGNLFAQEPVKPDTTTLTPVEKKKVYSAARKASIMSAILPGLGQAYNKKYWKIPLIYGGIGGFAYLSYINNEQYQYFRKNLIAENDDNPATVNESRYSSAQLLTEKQYYKKNRDFGLIGIAAVYLLNIVDANVDAHLKTFDVSDDLGIQLKPFNVLHSNGTRLGMANGLSIKLTF
jgi:hypothetical protein